MFYSRTAIGGYQETSTRNTPVYYAYHCGVVTTCFSMYSQILFTSSRNPIVHARLLVYTCLGIDVKTLKLVLARQWAGVWLGIG